MTRHAGLRWRAVRLAMFVRCLQLGVIVKRPGARASSAMRQQFPPSPHHGFSRQACALALAGALALAACSKKEAAAPAPRPVVALAVHAGGHPLQAASLPGEVQARYSTPLSFRVAGKIIE